MIDQYTRWLTVPIALLQGFGMYTLLRNQQVIGNLDVLSLTALIITMTAGTILSVWLGELITEYGMGNGISLLIFAGIVGRLPVVLGQTALTIETLNLGNILIFGGVTIL